MTLALFLFSLVITAWPVTMAHRAYGRIHDRSYGNWVVDDFFDWARSSIATISITSVILIMLIAEMVSDGLPNNWENIVIIGAVVFAVMAMLLTIVIQGVVRDKMYGRDAVDRNR